MPPFGPKNMADVIGYSLAKEAFLRSGTVHRGEGPYALRMSLLNDGLGRVLTGRTKPMAVFADPDGQAHRYLTDLLAESGLDTRR